jgi:hypothetical protein
MTLSQLDNVKDKLWNKSIPSMVGSYFSDIETILNNSHRLLREGGMATLVIGDSRYSGVRIDTAKITMEIAKNLGFELWDLEKIRVMKASAQQGWDRSLDETALYLIKN